MDSVVSVFVMTHADSESIADEGGVLKSLVATCMAWYRKGEDN